MNRRISWRFAIVLAGLFFLVVGTGLIWFGTRQISYTWAGEYLTLKNDSVTFDRWISPNQPSSLSVYIFNVTNSEEVCRGGFKPNLTELGPYVYQLIMNKTNLNVTRRPSVSYRLTNDIRFNSIASGNLTETDEIIVLNVPHVNFLLAESESNPEFSSRTLAKKGKIFLKTTVREFLFDGITIDCSKEETGNCWNWKNRSLPKLKNGTSRETVTVDPGILNANNSPRIIRLANRTDLNLWMDPYCDMINGSDGAQFSMPLNRGEKLYLYEGDLCRSVHVEFEKIVEEREIDLYRYVAKENLFASGDQEAKNECFCRPKAEEKGQGSTCLGNGLISLLPCTEFFLVASFPHFYLGDEKYVERSGLFPSKDIHQTHFDVEPNFGITVSSCKRFQFNMEMRRRRRDSNVAGFDGEEEEEEEEEEIFPILWTEEKTIISDDFYQILRFGLSLRRALNCTSIALIGLGFVLIAFSYSIGFLWKAIRERKEKLFPSVDFPIFSRLTRDKVSKDRPRQRMWQNPTFLLGLEERRDSKNQRRTGYLA